MLPPISQQRIVANEKIGAVIHFVVAALPLLLFAEERVTPGYVGSLLITLWVVCGWGEFVKQAAWNAADRIHEEDVKELRWKVHELERQLAELRGGSR